MKLKICIAAMLLLCLASCNTQAQKQSIHAAPLSNNIIKHPHPLSISDKVPLLGFKAIINAAYTSTTLQQLTDKLVILDFMATTCKGCIEALPRLDSLQAKYKGSLQVFLVTYEAPAEVKRFLKNNTLGKNTKLPFVTGDTLLSEWFPHSYISHDVWITPSRKVLAITECEYVSDENIQLALSGKPVPWPLKQDINLADNTKTLMRFSDMDSLYYVPPAAAYYTVLSKWLKTRQVGFEYSRDTVTGSQRFYMANYPAIGMYLLAYDTIGLTTGHIVLDVPDKQHFVYTKGVGYMDGWDRDNRYCYESIMPLNMSEAAMRQKVRDDLDSFFGLQTNLSIQEAACWVLHDTAVIKNSDTVACDSGKTHAATVGNMLYRMEHDEYGIPVLNESTADMETTLHITGKESVAELNAILLRYGLVISKLPRRTTMLTIKNAP
ncbi:MAG: hypothetical protein ABJB86_12070 [Bacteroidota bacterium]